MKERAKRSLIKSISWRVLATLTTGSLVYLFTGELKTAAEVGGAEAIAKMLLYYFHERLWNWIKWGTKSHPLEKLKVNHNLTEEDMVKIEKKLKELGYIDESRGEE